MKRIRFRSKGYSVHETNEDERQEIEREVEETRRREEREIERRERRQTRNTGEAPDESKE